MSDITGRTTQEAGIKGGDAGAPCDLLNGRTVQLVVKLRTALAAALLLGGLSSGVAAAEEFPVVTSDDTLLPSNPHEKRIGELEESLADALGEARILARESREARAEADAAGAEASAALVAAYDASVAAQGARERQATTQEMVNRWAAAAYRSTAVTAWELAALAGDDISELLHSSGLGDYAADFHALLLERAEAARVEAEAASRAAEASLLRARLLLDLADANERMAAAKVAIARSKVTRVRGALRRQEAASQAFAERLAIDLALGTPLILNIPVSGDILERASALKDVRPFAPGSGPNSTERMASWLALDVTVLPGTPRAYAVSQLSEYGWDLRQWPCLDRMWWHESGWDYRQTDAMQGTGYNELNPNLTWGIPQANPAIKMANPEQNGGPDWATNPITQINWGLWYIAEGSSYGSPCAAWDAWRARAATGSYGWY